MEVEGIKALAAYGPFAVLTFVLIYLQWKTNSEREGKLQATIDHTIKVNAEREMRYQQTIDKLADSLRSVEFIRKDIEDIKGFITSPQWKG